MRALQFTLYGRTGFFKNPNYNNVYFTFNHIHKVALLGMFGAILGLDGYAQLSSAKQMPMFYKKLKDMRVSIEPITESGLFNRSLQTYVNSVGYGMKQSIYSLVVKEQWLENPKWNIYVLLDGSKEVDMLCDYVLNDKAVYNIYLGNRTHLAYISDAKITNLAVCPTPCKVDSLFLTNRCKVSDNLYDNTRFKFYQEDLPIGLEDKSNLYFYKEFCLTNNIVDSSDDIVCTTDDNKNIMFY